MELETVVNRNLLKWAVSRQIFCQVSNNILDIRRAVLCTVTAPNGNAGSLIVEAQVWDKLAADDITGKLASAGGTVEVLDGRELYSRKRK